jgi:hypothetical protein
MSVSLRRSESTVLMRWSRPTSRPALGPRNEELDGVGQDAVVELRHGDEVPRNDIELVVHVVDDGSTRQQPRCLSRPGLAAGEQGLDAAVGQVLVAG